MLHVSEKTIYRWIKEKKIPVYQINHQYRFNGDEIRDWMGRNRVDALGESPVSEEPEERLSMSDLMQRGGIYYKVEGETVRDLIWNSVAIIPTPSEIAKESVAEAIYGRERMMNTAMGNGVAVPHTRTPIVRSPRDENLSVCFLNHPIDFSSLDGEPVHTIFIPLTASVQQHLEVLSKITFLCRQDEFMALLRAQASRGEIMAYVQERESNWELG
jgi:PTS system nitrogen regulatory IIA component